MDDDGDDIGFFGLPISRSKQPRNHVEKDDESAVVMKEGDDAFKLTRTKTTMKRKQQSGLHSFLRVKLPKTQLTGADVANQTACTLGDGMRISPSSSPTRVITPSNNDDVNDDNDDDDKNDNDDDDPLSLEESSDDDQREQTTKNQCVNIRRHDNYSHIFSTRKSCLIGRQRRQSISSVNILSLLLRRSFQPIPITTASNDFDHFVNRGHNWNTCQTVGLSIDDDDGEIRAMSFDRDGVLLATGDDRGNVRIYDFDEVRFMDMKRRNEISRLPSSWCKLESKSREQRMEERHAASGDEVEVNIGVNVATDDDSLINSILIGHIDSENVHDCGGGKVQIEPALIQRIGVIKISSVHWSPNNQDHLIVTFANSPEIHIYDIASDLTPLPCIRINNMERVSKLLFMHSSKSQNMRILTGGSRGGVRMWSIPTSIKHHRSPELNDFSPPLCTWLFTPFESGGGSGVCDMLRLRPNDERLDSWPNKMAATTRSHVLLAGGNATLVLLDVDKCTRKAFSTTVTPVVEGVWNLYHMMSRELSRSDKGAKLPPLSWMVIHRLSLLRCDYTDHKYSQYAIGIITKCGWMYSAELTISHQTAGQNLDPTLRLNLVHRTPRIRCYNSLNEPIANLGGMALQFSLPEMPILSTLLRPDVVWLGEVKEMRYTLPSKDKFVLTSDHGLSTEPRAIASSARDLRHLKNGLILARFDNRSSVLHDLQGDSEKEAGMRDQACKILRLSLSCGSPSALSAHPGGEWMVIGYCRVASMLATKHIELACLRSTVSERKIYR